MASVAGATPESLMALLYRDRIRRDGNANLLDDGFIVKNKFIEIKLLLRNRLTIR